MYGKAETVERNTDEEKNKPGEREKKRSVLKIKQGVKQQNIKSQECKNLKTQRTEAKKMKMQNHYPAHVKKKLNQKKQVGLYQTD